MIFRNRYPVNRRVCLACARYAALVFLVGLPLTSHFVISLGAHDSSRIAQLVLMIVCTACLVLHSSKTIGSIESLRASALIGTTLLVAALATTISSPSVEHATRELAMFLGLAGCAATFGCSDYRSIHHLILRILTVGTTAYATAIMSIVISAMLEGSPISRSELFFGYDNYRFFNHVQTVSLPFLGLATTSERLKGTIFKKLAWIGLCLSFCLLLITAGRATGLGLLVGCVAALSLFRRRAMRFVGHLLFAFLIGGIAYVALFIVIPVLTGAGPAVDTARELSSLDSYRARLYLWELALGYLRESPWFGIGPMHYAHRPNVEAAHPHSIYLQIAAEWGLPIALACVAVPAWGLWRMCQTIFSCIDSDERTAGIGLFAACIAVAVDGGFSGNFVMPMSQLWIAVLLGYAMAWHHSASSFATVRRIYSTRRIEMLAAVMLFLSQLWLVFSVYPEVRNLSRHLDRVQAELATGLRGNPRFWSYGWF